MNGPGPGQPAPYTLPCSFCATPTASSRCETCQRDPRGARRVCARCQKNTPVEEKLCMHCRQPAGSEMSWKIPVIVLMFVVAFAIAIALQTVR